MSFELFSKENEDPNSSSAILRRFVLWSLVCWVSAGPSFLFALNFRERSVNAGGFSPWAMAAAVTLFSILYTILTSTNSFDRFHRIRGMRRTLYIGYWTRMIVSAAFPLTMVVDVATGIVSVGAVNKALGMESGFATTFLITCVHGALMNLLIAIYMLLLYPIVRARSRPSYRPGFEVIMAQ